MTGKEYTDLVSSKIGTDWKAISIDGSAFDSSQFAPLMKSVDNRFFEMMAPFVRKVVEHNWNSFNLPPLVTPDVITRNLMKSLTSTSNIVFIKAPGVDSPAWPDRVRKKFFRNVDDSKLWRNGKPEKDWIYLNLEGTTFSGHSTRTTLGNTLRSLAYAWFYQSLAGIPDPKNSDLVFTTASGDDVVMYVHPDWA
jgi:hypothetical protein